MNKIIAPIDKWTILDFSSADISLNLWTRLQRYAADYIDRSGFDEHIYPGSLLDSESKDDLMKHFGDDFHLLQSILIRCQREDAFYFRIIDHTKDKLSRL